jgi:hypothetical protein
MFENLVLQNAPSEIPSYNPETIQSLELRETDVRILFNLSTLSFSVLTLLTKPMTSHQNARIRTISSGSCIQPMSTELQGFAASLHLWRYV